MPPFRNVYDHEDILGRPIAPVLAVSTGNAPTDEVHFCLPIWIVTGANGDVLVPVTRLFTRESGLIPGRSAGLSRAGLVLEDAIGRLTTAQRCSPRSGDADLRLLEVPMSGTSDPSRDETPQGAERVVAFMTSARAPWRRRIIALNGQILTESVSTFPSVVDALADGQRHAGRSCPRPSDRSLALKAGEIAFDSSLKYGSAVT